MSITMAAPVDNFAKNCVLCFSSLKGRNYRNIGTKTNIEKYGSIFRQINVSCRGLSCPVCVQKLNRILTLNNRYKVEETMLHGIRLERDQIYLKLQELPGFKELQAHQNVTPTETPAFTVSTSTLECGFCHKLVDEKYMRSMFATVVMKSNGDAVTFEQALGSYLLTFVPMSAKYCLLCLLACERVIEIKRNLEHVGNQDIAADSNKIERCKRKFESEVPLHEHNPKRSCIVEIKKEPDDLIESEVHGENETNVNQSQSQECGKKEETIVEIKKEPDDWIDCEVHGETETNVNQSQSQECGIKEETIVEIKKEPDDWIDCEVHGENETNVNQSQSQECGKKEETIVEIKKEPDDWIDCEVHGENETNVNQSQSQECGKKEETIVEIKKEPDDWIESEVHGENETNVKQSQSEKCGENKEAVSQMQAAAATEKSICHDQTQVFREDINNAFQEDTQVPRENEKNASQAQTEVRAIIKENSQHQHNLQNSIKEETSSVFPHTVHFHSDNPDDEINFTVKLLRCLNLDDIVTIILDTNIIRNGIEHRLLSEVNSACEMMCSTTGPCGPSILRKDLAAMGKIETDIFNKVVLEIAHQNPFLLEVLKCLCTSHLNKPSVLSTIVMIFAMGIHIRNPQMAYLQQINTCIVAQYGNTKLLKMLSKFHLTLGDTPEMRLLHGLRSRQKTKINEEKNEPENDLQNSTKVQGSSESEENEDSARCSKETSENQNSIQNSTKEEVSFVLQHTYPSFSDNPVDFKKFISKLLTCSNLDEILMLALDTKEFRNRIEHRLLKDICGACEMLCCKTGPYGTSILRKDLATSATDKMETNIFDEVVQEVADRNPFLLEILKTLCNATHSISKPSTSCTIAMMIAMGSNIRSQQLCYLQQLNSCIVVQEGKKRCGRGNLLKMLSRFHITRAYESRKKFYQRLRKSKYELPALVGYADILGKDTVDSNDAIIISDRVLPITADNKTNSDKNTKSGDFRVGANSFEVKKEGSSESIMTIKISEESTPKDSFLGKKEPVELEINTIDVRSCGSDMSGSFDVKTNFSTIGSECVKGASTVWTEASNNSKATNVMINTNFIAGTSLSNYSGHIDKVGHNEKKVDRQTHSGNEEKTRHTCSLNMSDSHPDPLCMICEDETVTSVSKEDIGHGVLTTTSKSGTGTKQFDRKTTRLNSRKTGDKKKNKESTRIGDQKNESTSSKALELEHEEESNEAIKVIAETYLDLLESFNDSDFRGVKPHDANKDVT